MKKQEKRQYIYLSCRFVLKHPSIMVIKLLASLALSLVRPIAVRNAPFVPTGPGTLCRDTLPHDTGYCIHNDDEEVEIGSCAFSVYEGACWLPSWFPADHFSVENPPHYLQCGHFYPCSALGVHPIIILRLSLIFLADAIMLGDIFP